MPTTNLDIVVVDGPRLNPLVIDNSAWFGPSSVLSHTAVLPSDINMQNNNQMEDGMSFKLERKKYICEHPSCHETFNEARQYKKHVAQHKWGPHEIIENDSGKTSFLCLFPNCSKMMFDRKVLRKHLLSHGDKQFCCTYDGCEKRFYERAKLKRHFLVHTGEKKFNCEKCVKTFGYKANLKTHMRTHSGDRPYPCSIPGCDRNFAQASNRNSHVLTHLKHINDHKSMMSSEIREESEYLKGGKLLRPAPEGTKSYDAVPVQPVIMRQYIAPDTTYLAPGPYNQMNNQSAAAPSRRSVIQAQLARIENNPLPEADFDMDHLWQYHDQMNTTVRSSLNVPCFSPSVFSPAWLTPPSAFPGSPIYPYTQEIKSDDALSFLMNSPRPL